MFEDALLENIDSVRGNIPQGMLAELIDFHASSCQSCAGHCGRSHLVLTLAGSESRIKYGKMLAFSVIFQHSRHRYLGAKTRAQVLFSMIGVWVPVVTPEKDWAPFHYRPSL